MGSSIKRLHRNAIYRPLSWIGIDEKQYAAADPLGQAIGAWDKHYKVETPEAIPSASTEAPAFVERDRARRLARRASGRDSTIRTSPQGAPYSGAPKSLLGS